MNRNQIQIPDLNFVLIHNSLKIISYIYIEFDTPIVFRPPDKSFILYIPQPCVIPSHSIVNVGEHLSHRQRTSRHVLQAVIEPCNAFVQQAKIIVQADTVQKQLVYFKVPPLIVDDVV